MRALAQRVTRSRVSIGGEVAAETGPGLVVLLGVARGDRAEDALFLANKVAQLRIFSDEEGKFNLSLLDMGGEALVVSQFTLMADTRKGRRPSFTDAAPPEEAQPLYQAFVSALRSTGIRVSTGQFQAKMLVEIFNDGPVTILLDSRDRDTR